MFFSFVEFLKLNLMYFKLNANKTVIQAIIYLSFQNIVNNISDDVSEFKN